MLYAMAESERYKNLTIEKFERIINKDNIEQFCAMTINISDNIRCISFCGTDDTIIGWKEDLNMIHSQAIPSQLKSKEYLENVSRGYKGNIYITGHSKGGNLAFYSGLHSNRFTKAKIINIYSFDGPGLNPKDAKALKKSVFYPKFLSYITECSIVGKLFENTAKTIICKSSNTGLMQHDTFSWLVEDDKLLRGEQQDSASISIDNTIKSILEEMNDKDRKYFTDTMFKIISYSSVDNLSDLKFKHKLSVIKGYFQIEQEERKFVNNIAIKMFKDKEMKRIVIKCILDMLSKKRPE